MDCIEMETRLRFVDLQKSLVMKLSRALEIEEEASWDGMCIG
jgi:aminoglycoside phosphotransferase family enzyme